MAMELAARSVRGDEAAIVMPDLMEVAMVDVDLSQGDVGGVLRFGSRSHADYMAVQSGEIGKCFCSPFAARLGRWLLIGGRLSLS